MKIIIIILMLFTIVIFFVGMFLFQLDVDNILVHPLFLLLIGSIITGIIIPKITEQWQNREDELEAYSDLDELYFKILKIGLENPQFRNLHKTKKYIELESDEKIKYETYAYMVWNVCETIFDRTKNNEKIYNTWKPVILAEKKLHTKWFDDGDNRDKFKDEFIDFIKKIK